MDSGARRQTVDWEELDKTRFYTYSLSAFLVVRVVLYPPFVIKTKIQMDRGHGGGSAFDVGRVTVRQEGIRGLYKGFWVSSGSLVFRQLYFTTYEVIRHHLGPGSELQKRLGPDKGEVVRNMVAGGGSSTVMQVFTVPFDLISQRMMVDSAAQYKSSSSSTSTMASGGPSSGGAGVLQVKEAVIEEGAESAGERVRRLTAGQVTRQVYMESGLGGFYRGFGASVLQFAPTSAIWWTAYGLYIRSCLRAVDRVSQSVVELSEGQRLAIAQAMAGLCTGMTTVVLTNPLDVLRTRLQVDGRRGDDRTIMSEYRALIRESGYWGLMRGLAPRALAMAPASVLVVSVYELIKRLSRKTREGPAGSAPSTAAGV